MLNTLYTKITPVRIVIASSIILIFGAVWWWFGTQYSSTTNVFDRMLYNTLATPGVSKVVSQNNSGQKLEQFTQLIASPQQRVRSMVVLKPEAAGDTVITTETIGTTSADFVRYVDIKTTQKTSEGKDFDFKPVLNIWGKADERDPSSGGAQLFNQTVLGVVPVGNITANQRKQLLNQIKSTQVYTVEGEAKKKLINSRLVYSYDVSVKPAAYVSMLKTFARNLGLKQLESVDPGQYAKSEPLKINLEVDVLSGKLIKVTHKDVNRTEAFSSYGARGQIDVPQNTVPIQELESRLQQIQ